MQLSASSPAPPTRTPCFSLTWTTTSASDSLFLDVISVFPTVGWRGLPFIRSDLADMIESIHPSVVRLPGGSYVDGVNIAGRFEWNNTLYGLEHRPGHPNLWGYWGEDGFGIYEMFSWAEKVRTDACATGSGSLF